MLLVILLRPKKCLQLLRNVPEVEGIFLAVVILVITLWPRFSMCKVEALKENKTTLGVLSRRLLPLPLSRKACAGCTRVIAANRARVRFDNVRLACNLAQQRRRVG